MPDFPYNGVVGRTVIAAGSDAVRQAFAVLSAGAMGRAPGVALEPGVQWAADRMLLSVDGGHVQFTAGKILYKQDFAGFLLAEFPAGGASARKASWMRDLSPYERPFCMGLGGELAVSWPATSSVRTLLERFSEYYRIHRSAIDLAARELHYISEALLALQHWTALFEAVMDSMGERARASLPNGVSPPELGAFLGRILVGTQSGRLTLARVPECLRAQREAPAAEEEDWLRIPQYRRMFGKLERSAESIAPVVEQLATAL